MLHWFLPSLFIPALAGTLISFHPFSNKLDPLTAAITRLAAHVVYPYEVDPLGMQWRVMTASVGLAFAFAEVIVKAPVAAAIGHESKQTKRALLTGPEGTIVEGMD